MKKYVMVLFLMLSALSLFLTGCGRGEDTRQYIDTIGIVFTNNANEVINELFIFPVAIDGTSVFEQDMGPDLIKNTSKVRRIGSFGVTIEMENTSYNIKARDRFQGIYIFGNVPLSNACEAILTFEGANPLLTVHHRSGEVHAIEGEHVPPGDAPDHAHVPLRRTATVQFTVRNTSDNDIVFISMREADYPSKGEVELLQSTLAENSSTSINYRLFEEDTEVTDWLLYVKTADGVSTLFEEPFNPWEINILEITMDGNTLVFTAS